MGYAVAMSNLPAPSPRPLRPRSNGWTLAKQAEFLQALAETASISEAARRVRMTPQAAHWLRRQPAAEEFRAGWDAALAEAWQAVEASVLERVLNGEIEIFERDGVRAMRQRPCAARLAIHVLERAMAGRDKAAAGIGAVKTAETGK
jgi:hypothetical protein